MLTYKHFYIIIIPLFLPNFVVSNWQLQSCPIGGYSLVSSLQLPYGLGRGKHREPCILRNTTLPSRTASWHTARLTLKPATPNVSEETPYSWRLKSACMRPACHKESLVRYGTRTSRPAKPSLNPDNAGPIVCRLMVLLVAAGCDTARVRTRVCRDASSSAMQCFKPLRTWEAGTHKSFE